MANPLTENNHLRKKPDNFGLIITLNICKHRICYLYYTYEKQY